MSTSTKFAQVAPGSSVGKAGWFKALRAQHSGTAKSRTSVRIPRRDLIFVLRNLATLVENGMPLTRSLATLAQERSLRRYAPVLQTIRRKVETGEMFSTAVADFPDSFSEVLVGEIRAGERAGTLPEMLERIAAQAERADEVRTQVVRKLAYPAVLVGAGTLAVIFMIVFVVPIFQQTYAEAKIPLPWITQAMITVGSFCASRGWIAVVVLVVGVWSLRRARRQAPLAYRIDRALLRAPVFGELMRNLAVLRLMDVFGNLLESGFTVVEALSLSSRVIGNRAIRRSVEELAAAVTRGERFSRELDRLGELFPPVVIQLVVVGEQTGNLAKATAHIREHLRRDIEHRTNVLVGTIEPVLTISLAAAIGSILLAIYLPMFDMIGAAGAR